MGKKLILQFQGFKIGSLTIKLWVNMFIFILHCDLNDVFQVAGETSLKMQMVRKIEGPLNRKEELLNKWILTEGKGRKTNLGNDNFFNVSIFPAIFF